MRLARRLAFQEARLRDRAMQVFAWLRRRPVHEQLYRMSPYWTRIPLLGRAGTSDWRVFHRVFVQDEYDFLERGDDIRCVVDCGAGVGYASAWLLSRYPAARCLAIEPDPGTFELLERNLSQFGNRVTLLRAGVDSLGMEAILSNAPPPGTVDLLKMDMEGSNTVVLNSGERAWLSRVSLLVVELRDDAAQAAFAAAMATEPFEVTRRGLLAAARRRHDDE